MSNELSIGGNSYGPNAVGRGARAVQRDVTIRAGDAAADDDRLLAAIAELRRLLDQHRAEIPEANRVERDIRSLEEEIGEPDRDKERLRDTVKRIAARVVLAAPVISAVNDVSQLVEALPG